MLVRHVKSILLITGLITLSAALALFAPGLFKAVNQIAVDDAVGLFFMRHWGLEVACVGGLLIWAAYDASVRVPVLWAAIVGKAGFVVLLLAQAGNPAFAGMTPTLWFDALCVVLFAGYLWQARRTGAT
jgi:hypothetical protein